ncbi:MULTISPECIES: SusC/RagA family TonB-linked outer membrane protein [Flavobacteriaceae]|uniref:SusC/RagA family TonB-linked outer membrane protein n=1 Tax=Flavobacteriaceae TaxID=49546 RepID=UPI001FEC04EB|nr:MULTISPECIES: TonB-dependent receptor [Allomuricauda]MDC6367701.1 TonB-dependent receptor [Muricauda sp. AC10]
MINRFLCGSFAKLRSLSFLSLSFLMGLSMHAQEIQVSGTVGDENGPLPGVSVVVDGTTNGVATDFDGNYTLSNVASDATLVFSYVGYNTENIAVNGRTTINVTMVENLESLDEVVIVAYGSQSRAAVTGAISTVGSEEISALPVATADQALQGRAAGITVTNSGSPGTAPIVRIRGVGSPNGGSPLYVIDGVISSDLGSINPGDIESINVLKDAATAAAYGSQAANGVIVVTTKQGRAGKTEVSFNTYTGIQYVTQRFDLLNTDQYLQFIEEAFGTVPTSPLSSSGNNTDWQDAIFQTGFMQNYDLSMAGGNEKSNFRASIGALKQEGAIIETGFNRYNVRLNSNFDVTDKFKIGETLSVTFSDQTPETGDNNAGSRSLLEHAIKMAPYLPIYNADNLGGFQGPTSALDGQDAENPVRIQENGSRITKRTQVFGSIFGEYELLKGLKFKSQFGLEYNYSNYDEFIPSFDDDSNGQSTHSQTFASIIKNSSTFRRYLFTNSLNYKFDINDDHRFDILAVAEKNEALFEQVNTASRNSVTDEIQQLTNEQSEISSLTDEVDKIGYLGRLNYSYKDKYLLSGSIRRDGSSRFGPSTKWGWFPSVSAGWNIAEENFMNSSDFNTLKLRASWGTTGFDEIRNYVFNTTLTNDFNYVISGNALTGVAPSSTPNPDVAWEEREMLNIGLDVGLFNNKFTAALEYFKNTSNDLLIDLQLPGSFGSLSSTVPTNIGDVESKGFEISLGYNDYEGDFTWSANLNLSTTTNEVLNTGVGSDIIPGAFFENQLINGLKPGEPVFAFYGFQMDGIYQTQAEVEAVLGTDQTAIQPGDIRFVDQNGDQQINNDDIVAIGNPTPEIIFGLNLDGNYKNWDFNIFINGVAGNDIYNTNLYDLQGMPRTFNAGVEVLDRWTPTNPSNSVPRAFDGNNGINVASSSRFIEDGSFARLKNFTVGYTFGSDSKISEYVSRLRLYLSGQNLVTLTGYSGLDPEIGNAKSNNFEFGVDRGNYPQPKSVLVGLQVTF